MYFEIYLSGTQYRWRLKSANHEPIASGEAYTSKQNCEHAITLVKGSYSATVKDLTK